MNESPPTTLLRALFDARAQLDPVPKASEMDAGKFGYSYASAADVVRYASAQLHAHGLALIFHKTTLMPGEKGRGVVHMAGVVFHSESGETLNVFFEAPYVASNGRPDDKASQASIATGEARAYRLLLGLTTADAEDEVASYSGTDEPATVMHRAAPAPSKPPAVPAAKPAPAKAPPAKTPEQSKPPAKPRTEAGTDGAPEPTPSSDADAERFAAISKRLGLDTDTAVMWASRMPPGAKIKADPKPGIFTYADGRTAGGLALLAEQLEDEAATLKARKIHPVKRGWTDAVKRWAANQITY